MNEGRPPNVLNALSWLSAVGSLAVIISLLLYMHGNNSNHTAFEPWLLSAVFVPSVIAGLTAFLRGRSRWGALLACSFGLGGMALLFYLDHFDILVQYDRLMKRGG